MFWFLDDFVPLLLFLKNQGHPKWVLFNFCPFCLFLGTLSLKRNSLSSLTKSTSLFLLAASKLDLSLLPTNLLGLPYFKSISWTYLPLLLTVKHERIICILPSLPPHTHSLFKSLSLVPESLVELFPSRFISLSLLPPVKIYCLGVWFVYFCFFWCSTSQ